MPPHADVPTPAPPVPPVPPAPPATPRRRLARVFRRHRPGEAKLVFWLFLVGHLGLIAAAVTVGRRVLPNPWHRVPVGVALSFTYAMAILVLLKRRRMRRFVHAQARGQWFGVCLACGAEVPAPPGADAPRANAGTAGVPAPACPACGAPATPLAQLRRDLPWLR